MRQLQRELGVFGATMMGLGSIVDTGIFVSLGIAAGVAGPAVLLACLFLAFWVETSIWFIELALIGLGLLWQRAAQRLFAPQ